MDEIVKFCEDQIKVKQITKVLEKLGVVFRFKVLTDV